MASHVYSNSKSKTQHKMYIAINDSCYYFPVQHWGLQPNTISCDGPFNITVWLRMIKLHLTFWIPAFRMILLLPVNHENFSISAAWHNILSAFWHVLLQRADESSLCDPDLVMTGQHSLIDFHGRFQILVALYRLLHGSKCMYIRCM
jgi:hypothetical protein